MGELGWRPADVQVEKWEDGIVGWCSLRSRRERGWGESLAAGGESHPGKLLRAHHGSRGKSSRTIGASGRDVHMEEESYLGEK
jgi:lysophospholipase L1-like esterase